MSNPKISKVKLKNKRITLGLTGGIAIYKSASLLRRLVADEGADVTVVMTAAAQRFMTPLIFETFSGKPVVTERPDSPAGRAFTALSEELLARL